MSGARDLHDAAGSTAACLVDARLNSFSSASASAFAAHLHGRALRVTRVGDLRLLPVTGRQEH
ncbi:hypothetical protein XvhCFBP2543_02335 [Xanthomonas vasicola]|uniref:STAS domain-containing protein n=1 Tax=Xanthomonas vasicola TaxID=56459 RepID=A0ABD7SFB7_XANVA|nr:hypothetical protein NX81_015895 [Xanthomonas vasicola]KGR44371.1 hypothetical protein NX04_07145 [Xanthomonas vasicola]KGR44545.1 hypothetical protein NX05_09615 [Xanthomonas vasicola]KGR58823.1 hypothetical protein NX79_17470 [Xanthomonas vasicola]PPV04182.1 hypothetical protein XvhCFBP2543_02335 [Xanthomonas vasicola]